MSTMRLVLGLFFKRMTAYVFLVAALGVVAYKVRLSGNETYVLDGLLALTIAAIAEYRAARAELLLALATKQPPEKFKPLGEAPQNKVIAPRPYSSAPQSAAASPKPAARPSKITFSTAIIWRIFWGTLLLLVILFVAGLIFFWEW